jgi:hypothetical protein
MSANIVIFDRLSKSDSLTSGLVSYYKLDETSGNAIDSVGGNNGTVSGCTQNVVGKINTAYTFAKTDYVSLGKPANLTALAATGTIAFWVYPTDLTTDAYHVFISNNDYLNDKSGIDIEWDNGTGFVVYICDAAGAQEIVCSTITLTVNTWNLVIVMWNGSNVTVYLNGRSAQFSTAQSKTPIFGAYDWHFGQANVDTSDGRFVGKLDEIGFWNRLLTNNEIDYLYNNGTGRTYPFN